MTQTEASAQLDQLVADALDRWPDLAYRTPSKRRSDISRGALWAHAAARYIRMGLVLFVEELPSLIDSWQVNGHQCSYHGKICDCLDLDAPYDAEHGRLCKHRLAVLFTQELQAQPLAYLRSVFALCNAQRVPSIKWEAPRGHPTHYVNNLHRQGSELIAWQPKGYEPFVLAAPVDFTIRQLQDILWTTGWRVTPGARVNQAQRAPPPSPRP
jgi:hypothetical protein